MGKRFILLEPFVNIAEAVNRLISEIKSKRKPKTPLDPERPLSRRDLASLSWMLRSIHDDWALRESMRKNVDFMLDSGDIYGGSCPGSGIFTKNNYWFFAEYDAGTTYGYKTTRIAYGTKGKLRDVHMYGTDNVFPNATTIYLNGECIPRQNMAMWQEVRNLIEAEALKVQEFKAKKAQEIKSRDQENLALAERNSRNTVAEVLLNSKVPQNNLVSSNSTIDSYIARFSKRSDGKELASHLSYLKKRIEEIRDQGSERAEDGPSLYSYTGEVVAKILPELLDPYLALPVGTGNKVRLENGDTALKALLRQIEAVEKRIEDWESPRQLAQIEINDKYLDDVVNR